MSPRATMAAMAGACAVLAGAGCSSISLRASEARTPILLGPVDCIGCAPAGRAAASPTVAGGVREREVAVPLLGGKKTLGTPLDVAATNAVADPCREDLHVSRIESGTWVFDVPLLFVMAETWVDVQASRTAVPDGTCGKLALAKRWPHGDRERDVRAAARPEEAVNRDAWARMAALGALLACGCAGARVTVSADSARYPVSLSGVVRDRSGHIYNRHALTKVGTFSAHRTPVGVAYSAWTLPSTYDISDEINRQVALSCGEAVVNLAVSISNACAVLNGFPALNALPSWIGCVPLTVTGDIVRRAEAGCPATAEP